MLIWSRAFPRESRRDPVSPNPPHPPTPLTPPSPPAAADDLDHLLAPLRRVSEAEALDLDPEGRNPDQLLTEELLAFDHLGLPVWWPNPAHNLRDRRQRLLERMREILPEGFHPRDDSPSQRRQLVSTLRRIASELTS